MVQKGSKGDMGSPVTPELVTRTQLRTKRSWKPHILERAMKNRSPIPLPGFIISKKKRHRGLCCFQLSASKRLEVGRVKSHQRLGHCLGRGEGTVAAFSMSRGSQRKGVLREWQVCSGTI